MTVFVYVNTSEQVGDAEHIKVFADTDAAEKWFEENDPEGVAFEYEVRVAYRCRSRTTDRGRYGHEQEPKARLSGLSGTR
jgi:hypothetical protein